MLSRSRRTKRRARRTLTQMGSATSHSLASWATQGDAVLTDGREEGLGAPGNHRMAK